ncbi:hypothetical protein HQ590_00350 [bacterium]|nr:hypothetical protein [bacterium]
MTVAFQRPLVFVIGLLVLLPLTAFIYRRQLRNLGAVPPWLTAALTLTRVVVLLLLVLALAGPYLRLDYRRERKPIVAVLIDHTQSMDLAAGPFPDEAKFVKLAAAAGYQTPDGKVDPETRKALNRISRAQLAQSILQAQSASFFEPLAEKYDLQVSWFDRTLHPVRFTAPDQGWPVAPPLGDATYLGEALARVLDDTGGRQVAGLVVVTDGQNTGGMLPVEVAPKAAMLNIPIFAVPPGGYAILRDVSVVDVTAPGQVSLGDRARVTATLESHDLDGKLARVQLLDGDTELDVKEIALKGSERQQVDLSFEASRPGTRYLTVQVAPLPDESAELQSNNADSALVRVSREKLRLLYVEGLPRWDFRFLKNALRRDHGFAGLQSSVVDLLLEAELRRRPADEQAQALPVTAEELARYHTILLGDVSPRLLTPPFISALVQAVRERGLGLVVLAGPRYMPHAYGEDLLDLLPVRLHRQAAGLQAPAYRPFRSELTPAGMLHDAMRLDDDPDRNQALWARMPPFYWCAAAESPAPGATVLAWNSSVGAREGALPLVVHHFAGEGRVVFIGTDSTWAWRQNAGDRFFYKFWGQMLRFVARRDPDQRTSSLEVRPVRIRPQQTAEIELLAFDADGAPRTDRSLTVSVFSGKTAEPVRLRADPAQKGRYTGSFTPEAAGKYRLLFDTGGMLAPVEVKLRVIEGSEELRLPNVNRAVLEQLASSSGGGQVVELTDLDTIPSQLKGENHYLDVRREASLWDNWLMLVLLVLIYCADVGMRRLRGLA